VKIECVGGAHSSHKAIFTYLGAWSIKFLLMTVVVVALLIISDWSSFVSAQADSIHIVRPGENLNVIARRYGVSVNELARHNGIANPNLVRVGQSLRIPAPASSSPSAQDQPQPLITPAPRSSAETNPPSPDYSARRIIYTVRPNDGLYGISRRFGVTVEAIKLRNGLRGDMIWVGQRLIIP
jgi:LysM repeat protein